MMNKKSVVSSELQAAITNALAVGSKDLLDSSRQHALGLHVTGISSMKMVRNSYTWKKWRSNWIRRKQAHQEDKRDINTPEDFVGVQTNVLAPERLCFYLAAYTCIAQLYQEEVVADVQMRRKEALVIGRNGLRDK